jgi:hypothetical protein
MSSYKIAIPSYNRAEGIFKRTLSTLKRYNIDNELIYIFVNTEEQKADYENKIPKEYYGEIVVTNQEKGIKNVRNFIVDYFEFNQKFISMDDDVVAIQELAIDKLVDINNLHSLIEIGFDVCEKNNFTLWGLYPIANPFYMKSKNTISTDLKFIVGGFMGIINKKRKVNLDWKEDYELSIEAYIQDGGLIRFNNICVKHQLYLKTGGIGKSQTERISDYQRSAEWLIEKYPEFVKMNKRREGKGETLIRSKKKKTI